MKRGEREAAVRRVMERAAVPVPPELYADAVRHGDRLLRRRRLVRRMLGLLACAAAVAFAVWAAGARPWAEPPSGTTPPVTGWQP
ncbi:hypothetical protein [Streptomyces sp. NPDC051129]|uniref:hypothetical protein n=1 Tax=unclassified Streptomyces TaxID=2593676 RepID=UPI00343B78DF